MVCYLLQERELLGYVLCTVLILAEGQSFFIVQASAGELIHQGAVTRHGQSHSNGEGLLFRHGCRGLHHSRDPPLQSSHRGLEIWEAMFRAIKTSC